MKGPMRGRMEGRTWRMLATCVLLAVVQAAPLAAEGGTAQGGRETYAVGDRLQQLGGKEDSFREITWDDLIPPDWMPEKQLEALFDSLKIDALDDQDPRAMEAMAKIREAWDNAPVVERLDGQRIRIPGFVVPLDGGRKEIDSFLLVPYFGACIHVPPPPLNQLIHVMPDTPIASNLNMMPVWVSGVLTVARFDSALGNAGYQLRGMRVVPYEPPAPPGKP